MLSSESVRVNEIPLFFVDGSQRAQDRPEANIQGGLMCVRGQPLQNTSAHAGSVMTWSWEEGFCETQEGIPLMQ